MYYEIFLTFSLSFSRVFVFRITSIKGTHVIFDVQYQESKNGFTNRLVMQMNIMNVVMLLWAPNEPHYFVKP